MRIITFLRKKRGFSVYIAKILNIFLKRKALKLGFFIPDDVFGPGLYIPHFGSIIVNPNTKIGCNCQINNNVTIGQVRGKCPQIGNNVYIGPGAVVSGNIVIADNVWIGANSVVIKDVLTPYALVGGIPAAQIRIKKTSWVEEFGMI